jgi:MFS transporter, YNFM family, putative membrane transport protein
VQASSPPGIDRHTLAVVFAGICAFLVLYATQPMLPLLEQIFHASKVAVSLTVTAGTLGVALAAPGIGSIADRFGRKRVIIVSAFLLALATLGAATSTSLRQLLWWRFLQGVFTPGIFAITVAYIQEEWAGAGAGSATAAYTTGTVIGGFSGRLTSGLVASHWGWPASFLALGLFTFVGAAILWRWLPIERRFLRHPHHGSGAALIAHATNPRLLATFAAGFCVLFSLLGTFTYVTFYLAAPPFRLTTAALGSLFFVYLVGAVITPFAGRSIDRYGHRAALLVSMSTAICGVLLTLSHNLWIVIAGLALCCTGVFVTQSAANSYIGSAAEHNKALAVGLYVSFYYLGGSAGGALPGFFWTLGGWPACVALFVSVQAATILIALGWWKGVPREIGSIEENEATLPT